MHNARNPRGLVVLPIWLFVYGEKKKKKKKTEKEKEKTKTKKETKQNKYNTMPMLALA